MVFGEVTVIIGHGLIANCFQNYLEKDIIIFASGVSNSNEENKDNFLREKKLLEKTILENKDKVLVYFSSCDVVYAAKLKKDYYFHKLNMEKLISDNANNYYIFRLPQIIGFSSNRNSLINFFIHAIKEKKVVTLWQNAYKNLIDIESINQIVNYCIEREIGKNNISNVINPNYYSVLELVGVMENILGVNAKKNLLNMGFKPEYESTINMLEIGINFEDNYLEKSIKKYYH